MPVKFLDRKYSRTRTERRNKSRSLLMAAILLCSALHAEACSNRTASSNLDRDVVALSIDNDIFVPSTSDRDFTAGFALTHSGNSVREHWHGADRLIAAIDSALGITTESTTIDDYVPSVEIGSYGFTPDNIDDPATLTNDRPYASLVYFSTSRAYINSDAASSAWTSTLSIGVLGLSFFESVQNGVHRVVGSEQAEGWDHQVADGGELTFRYQAAYHDYWPTKASSRQYKTTYFGSVGYLTEVGIALSTRQGRIASPDYRFNPELITYGERVSETLATPYAGKENYFWGGIALKARLYNAFLQGQFRSSDHTLGSGDVRILIVESWLGYTRSLGADIKLSYVLRAHSSEIRHGKGNRTVLWGGLVMSRSL